MPAPRGWTLFADEYTDIASSQGDRRPDFQAALRLQAAAPFAGVHVRPQIVLSGHTAVRLEDNKIVEDAVWAAERRAKFRALIRNAVL